jgi:predicted nucleotidyltransferase
LTSPTSSGQSWASCDPDVRDFVRRTADAIAERLGRLLVGVYLHGSLAMGCYRRPKSDVDLLVVVRGRLDPAMRGDLARLLVRRSDARPATGDMDVHVVAQRFLDPFDAAAPVELAYSEDRREALRRGEVDLATDLPDEDLPAVCTTVRARGGGPTSATPRETVGEVPWDAFVGSVLGDAAWIVDGEHILETPFYGVLNLCRALCVRAGGPGTVVSKAEGAAWALGALPPAHHAVVRRALEVYQSGEAVTPALRRTGGVPWDAEALLRFRDYARGAVLDDRPPSAGR